METWSWADVIDAEYVPPKKSNVSDLSWYAEARKMREQGYTLDDIGYKFGRTRERVRQVCEGIEPKGKMPRLRPKHQRRERAMSEEGKARLVAIRELAMEGLTAKEAGERLGITRNAVLGMAFRNKIKFPIKTRTGERTSTAEKRERIKAWLATHPFAKQSECAVALGMNKLTLNGYAKAIRAEWLNKENDK